MVGDGKLGSGSVSPCLWSGDEMGSLDGVQFTMSRGYVGVGNDFGGKGIDYNMVGRGYVWVTRGC